ncbi:Spore protein SP21 [Pontiella desulfatans]|uniref:Spore protein SP21 n=1 Tax=Pontiella desulfatans TaxID=2750659 RepID=A0A6C2UAY3_PONDE|nr:Hsp20/alpha crystallin family protein [Pontiella desulfatans]VGO16476.1 Spore protein SP21 [Pontiella desulfatans]
MKDKLVPWKKRDEHPFDLLHREINDLFDVYYHGFGGRARRFAGDTGYEVSETDDEIRVKAELPGMEEKDIEVTIDEEVLTIRGERQEQHEEKKRNYRVSEMSHGSFFRSFPLRVAIDRNKVKAKFKRGVLTLTLPKTEQAKTASKRIPISTD